MGGDALDLLDEEASALQGVVQRLLVEVSVVLVVDTVPGASARSAGSTSCTSTVSLPVGFNSGVDAREEVVQVGDVGRDVEGEDPVCNRSQCLAHLACMNHRARPGHCWDRRGRCSCSRRRERPRLPSVPSLPPISITQVSGGQSTSQRGKTETARLQMCFPRLALSAAVRVVGAEAHAVGQLGELDQTDNGSSCR